MMTLDTSGIVALMNSADRYHQQAVALFRSDPGPHFMPAAILSEIAYVLESRVGPRPALDVVENLRSGAFTLDCGQSEFARIQELMTRYEDLGLGLADAAVVACAERHAGRTLAADFRHFPVVARGEGTIVPLLVPVSG
jgi:predicted nucleic acid-binding protein